MNVTEMENKEIEAWKNSEKEGIDDFTIENIINKIQSIKFFYRAVTQHDDLFRQADSILELGGGARLGFLYAKKEIQYKKNYHFRYYQLCHRIKKILGDRIWRKYRKRGVQKL
jgi:hypothetical protein